MKHRLIPVCVFLVGASLFWLIRNPPIAEEESRHFLSTKILDRNGRLLAEFPSAHGTFSTWAPLSEVSPHLVQATLAAEDRRFFSHAGIDPIATVRAAVQNLSAGRIVRGASTIPQQLLRIVKKAPRTLMSKVRLMVESVRLSLSMDKKRQLEWYVNVLPYGGNRVGITEASRSYFGAVPKNLTLAQSAFLAVIPKSPERLDPTRNFPVVKKMQEKLLQRMRAIGWITHDELDQALSEKIVLRELEPRLLQAPHFAQFIKKEAGVDGAEIIHTTLDLDWQLATTDLLKAHLARVSARHQITNGAVVVLENATGEVRVWIGSHDFFDSKNSGQVDGVIARRQPGSALKPFVYSLALQEGFTAASILPDIRTHYPLKPGEYYIPRNYSGEYRGPVRLREALAGSLNVPAVHVAKEVGPVKIQRLLHDLGLELPESAWHYGLGITLGNPEVRLIDLANAYATLARGGKFRPAILSDPSPQSSSKQVIPEEVAALITDILADTKTRDRFFGVQNPFHFDFPAAVKTGTSSNWKDNWSFGFTPDVTVGVWIGNFDGAPMRGASGATGAGPLLRDVLTFVAGKFPKDRSFAGLEGLTPVSVCPLSGLTPGPHCPDEVTEYLVPGTGPEGICDWHRLVRYDRRNGDLASASCPAEHLEEKVGVVFPREFREWATEHGMGVHNYSSLCKAGAVQSIAVTYPKPDSSFLVDPAKRGSFQTIPLKADIDGDPEKVVWWVDGEIHSILSEPHVPARYQLLPGKHTVVAEADGLRSTPVQFQVY